MAGLRKMNRWMCNNRAGMSAIGFVLGGVSGWAIHQFLLEDKLPGSPLITGVTGALIGAFAGYASTSPSACKGWK